jgi:hypothetical protein
MKKWQLKRLSTDEALNEPQDLPDNWKNISSLKGSIDRLNDLAWAGHPDMGWFEVDTPEPVIDRKKFIDDQIAHQLQITLPMVAADNINITKAQRQAWLQYRRELQEIQYQEEYPETIRWPIRPE